MPSATAQKNPSTTGATKRPSAAKKATAAPSTGDPADVIELPGGRKITRAQRDEGLEALTATFDESLLEYLPKPVRRDDQDRGWCREGSNYSVDGIYCGKKHSLAQHLTYVGHGGITDRFNQVDPEWEYEFMHVDLPAWTQKALEALYAEGTIDARSEARDLVKRHGIPQTRDGGYWIKLTILGITRMGFGDSDSSMSGRNVARETKIMIGDALRNAAMRFGVGTYLWSKSEYAIEAARGYSEPEPEFPELNEEVFTNAMKAALIQEDTVDYLRRFKRSYAEDALRALAVTRQTGEVARAFDVLDGLIAAHDGSGMERVSAQPAPDGAHAQPPADAHAQDAAESAPARAQDERAHSEQDARAAEDGARAQDEAHARAQDEEARTAERAQEEARRDAARARQQEQARAIEAGPAKRAAATDKVMRKHLLEEIHGQARTVGQEVDVYAAPLFNGQAPGAGWDDLPTSVLRRFVFSMRAAVIEAMRAQGRVSQATSYARAAQAHATASWDAMTRPDDEDRALATAQLEARADAELAAHEAEQS